MSPYFERPPSDTLREVVAKGLVPARFVELFPSERCRCGHVRPVHLDSTWECDARKCPCLLYRVDPAWELPAFRSRPIAEVGPVIPAVP